MWEKPVRYLLYCWLDISSYTSAIYNRHMMIIRMHSGKKVLFISDVLCIQNNKQTDIQLQQLLRRVIERSSHKTWLIWIQTTKCPFTITTKAHFEKKIWFQARHSEGSYIRKSECFVILYQRFDTSLRNFVERVFCSLYNVAINITTILRMPVFSLTQYV